ncbi:MAG TPA: alpha-L-arabinofuranosidase C-terminal domain-containing protein [Edaphobacter sp.]|uniref:alpha-N-arabinofuranosidase n=1 Tax=Edaphobacter sp. TaxID=1934404 RepID=UPI002CDB9F8A|nr:alpha-L-arabinofuranosidase C-terminal domain-containing protein [Edaphobacter sp.]HUZ96401.1 alpha-L-arabinofuranosidase C-terminal domain-containing protein [Edaphobacter sp.]
MERRQFLRNSAITGAAFAFSGAKGWAKSADAHIDILIDEPKGEISPNIYGQFTEHIGGVIYDGVWVGEKSKIPNRYGIRSELIDKMKQIHVPIIRWPGGCFADSYDWKDGIGPASKRPRRTNFWEGDHDAIRLHEKGPQIFEPNEFGTDEFMRFCRLTQAQPYLAANLRSLPALDLDHWVEYCNSPAGSTTLADVRASGGFPEPFNVRYWGIGNESWGCGGNFTPEEYASEFRRYTTWIPGYGLDLQLIGSGPNDNDIDWTHRFFEQIYSDHAYHNRSFTGWSVHHYASDLSRGRISKGDRKGDALQFDSVDWYELLRQCDLTEQIIQDQWTAMGQYDTDHHVKLVVDEYGPWYREGTELDPTHIFGQQITMRDALATALTLDIFNRHSEKVSIATCAQLINNLNALFLAHEDRFFATPNFHVFAMYAAHQGGEALRTVFSAPDVRYMRDGKSAQFWGLNGSASRKGQVVTLTIVNPDLSKATETQIALGGARIIRADGTVLAAADMHAHNTFDRPNAVTTANLAVAINGEQLSVTLPPASVTKLTVTLG